MKHSARLLACLAHHRRWFLAAFALCAAILVWGHFAPSGAQSSPFPDKVEHILGFFALAITGRIGLLNAPGLLLWVAFLALALAMEYLQHLVQPSRTFSLWDIAANLTGLALAWVALAITIGQRK